MKIYLARGNEIPKIGKPLKGFLQRLKRNGEWEFLTHTSEVRGVLPLNDDIYVVKTRTETIYIFQRFDLEKLEE